jgi:hypothetical protein
MRWFVVVIALAACVGPAEGEGEGEPAAFPDNTPADCCDCLAATTNGADVACLIGGEPDACLDALGGAFGDGDLALPAGCLADGFCGAACAGMRVHDG